MISPRPRDHYVPLDLYCSFSLFALTPARWLSGMIVRDQIVGHGRVGGWSSIVPASRWRWNRPWNAQALEIAGELRPVPKFQRSALTREACAHAYRRAHHGLTYWNSGTVELWIEAIERLGFSSSTAVPASCAGWNRASIKIGGGYASAGAIRPDQHRVERAARQNFWDRAQLAAPIGRDLDAIEAGACVVQALATNGGFPPFPGVSGEAVGMVALELSAESVADQVLSLRHHKPVRLGTAGAGVQAEAGGVDAAATGGGAPNGARRSRRMLPLAIFLISDLIDFDADKVLAAEILTTQTGSGDCPRLCRARLDRGQRQIQAVQDRVGEQSGVLVPAAKAGGVRRLARGVSHVN